ncbi:hypothetical protein BASA61_009871 [Batrachochytrium salamandrivorans]|nr:hypothetical protein BASA61_009871 [Batrachochytrium salamandrivorans]KAH9254529.1 hypothetical protein BASA81_007471 [Batrachochytrium salamandrivorans]KAH9268856.1 hypothetical protein BASA83_009144 [Batrachochytrium salamandrivorans]KAJ1345008.1 hypothetical protein BSLG_000523 [Batrachochytrium salamandrivorans]
MYFDSDRDNADLLFAQCQECLSHGAANSDQDALDAAKGCLTHLAHTQQHVPSLVWLAIDAWPSDKLFAIDCARKAIREEPQADTCRMLGDWLWDISLCPLQTCSNASSTPIDSKDLQQPISRVLPKDGYHNNKHNTVEFVADLADLLGYSYEKEDDGILATMGRIHTHQQSYIMQMCRTEAMSCWTVAAETLGDELCIQRMATALAYLDDKEGAISWWRRAADLGNDAAISLLARQFIIDADVGDESLVIARKRGSDSDLPDTNRCRGTQGIAIKVPCSNELENSGDDLDERHRKTIEYVHRAANSGDPLCRRALGDIGMGLLNFSNSGLTDRSGLAVSLSNKSTETQDKDTSEKTPLEWYISAIESGDKISLLRAASLLYFGKQQSLPEVRQALDYYVKSARESQQQPSMAQVAHLVRSGDTRVNLAPDAELAFAYYNESASSDGCVESMRILGDMLWAGDGCEKNVVRACEMYERASLQHDMAATLGYVRCLWMGVGTPKDVCRAREMMKEVLQAHYIMGDKGEGVFADSKADLISEGGCNVSAMAEDVVDMAIEAMMLFE